MENKTNWYVLFVMGGKEQQICDFMNQEYDNWKVFIPKIEIIHTKQGKEFFVEKVMFPSYLFIESDIPPKGFQDLLKNIRMKKTGIIKELKFDEETPALRDDEREYLEGLLNHDYKVTKSTGYIENDKVMITDGPLKGYESYITRIDRHKKKAVLSLDLLNKEVNVTVSLEIIKKI